MLCALLTRIHAILMSTLEYCCCRFNDDDVDDVDYNNDGAMTVLMIIVIIRVGNITLKTLNQVGKNFVFKILGKIIIPKIT